MGNPVTWFDLGAADPAPLKTFYPGLFGWTLREISEGYTMVLTGGGVNGGIGRSLTGDPWSAFYVEVDDPQATLDKAESLGAKTVVPVTDIGIAVFAMFTDPDGLLIGLFKLGTGNGLGDGSEEDGAGGPTSAGGATVDRFEVLGSDMKGVRSFYSDVFGWSMGDGDENYALVDTGAGTGIRGGVGASTEESRWATVYATVDDVERYLARAEELGGTRVYGPIDVDDHMQSGAFRDPAGNVFGVYHHQPHE